MDTMARLKELMAERNLTLYGLAQLCDIQYSTLKNTAAQTGAFTLYEVTGGPKPRAKKLGQGGNPAELELKYGVREKMTA